MAELQDPWEVPERRRAYIRRIFSRLPHAPIVFPAFYLSLLVEEARGRRAVAAAAGGAAITVALMPVAPAGLPVIAASLAALIGLRRT